jgi:acid phosphatase
VEHADTTQHRSRLRTGVAILALALWCLQAAPAAATVSPPANLSAPTISGKTVIGSTLTASPGSWTNSPTSYAYRWQRCNLAGAHCVVIAGAASPTYVLAAGDLDSTLIVRVTASNAGGHATARSAKTGVVTAARPPASPAHVMVIVEENRNRSEVMGASNMPYFNSLAANHGDTTAWNGVSHPSLPNYLALISGSTQNVSTDGCQYSFAGPRTIGSQLSADLVSWKAYMEELPAAGSEVCTSGGYAKKHNPFAYFPATNGSSVVPATQFSTDLSSGKLPPFIFYVPNLTNDGHDGTNQNVDAYLKGLVPQVMASTWFRESGIIIITWDESNGEEKTPTVVVTGAAGAKVLSAAGNHYGTLASIEDLYGLPRLEHAAGATSLAPLFK